MSRFDKNIELEIISKYKNGYRLCNLIKEYETTKKIIYGILDRNKISRPKLPEGRKYFFDYYIFDKIDTEDKAYWLGFLYADGYNSEDRNTITLALAAIDYDHLVKYCKFLKINKEPELCSEEKRFINAQLQYRVSATHFNTSKKLAELGCYQKKSLTLEFPSSFQVPDSLMSHFIRGYFDGDGHVSIKKIRDKNGNPNKHTKIKVHITSSSLFITKMTKYIQSILNVKFYTCIANNNNLTSTMALTGRHKAIEFLNFIYNNATIYLDRKYKVYQEILKYKNPQHREVFVYEAKDLKFVSSYPSFQSASQALNIGPGTIRACYNGETKTFGAGRYVAKNCLL